MENENTELTQLPQLPQGVENHDDVEKAFFIVELYQASAEYKSNSVERNRELWAEKSKESYDLLSHVRRILNNYNHPEPTEPAYWLALADMALMEDALVEEQAEMEEGLQEQEDREWALYLENRHTPMGHR